jgi:hypothetical protein
MCQSYMDAVLDARELVLLAPSPAIMSSPERNNSSESDRDSEKIPATAIQAETKDLYTDDAVDPTYQAKARILNNAIQEIGMGKYQVGSVCF